MGSGVKSAAAAAAVEEPLLVALGALGAFGGAVPQDSPARGYLRTAQ